MIKLKTDLVKIVTCKKGEILAESVVSFLVFAILMMAVITMIVTSLRITTNYTTTAGIQQVNANMAILEKTPVNDVFFTITGNGIDVDVKVKLSQEGNFKAFYPEVLP